MNKKSFKDFVLLKEVDVGQQQKDWRKEFIQLEKGFIPPAKMRPVINAFLNSGDITVMSDTSKPLKMPKKALFLVGGPVRDFLKGKASKDFDMATNATPSQMAQIFHIAGFHMSVDRSGAQGAPLKIGFKPILAKRSSSKTWFIKGRDSSKERKPFVISAVVNGEEFEIATLRRDAKVTDGAAQVDFVDNPTEDASRRDLTINALYIELTKPDGENNKLYDPTGKGWHDVKNNVVRSVGKAEDRFQEDKLRILRAIRFHARFGSTERMDPEIERALPRFAHMDNVALERIRDEFLKGLLHPDTDVKRYLAIYKRTGLIGKVFPGVELHPDIPAEFSSRRDKPLALAWLMQGNPPQQIAHALGSERGGKPTGWANQELRAVQFLLALKEMTPEVRPKLLRQMRGTGLTRQQIRDWVDMFRYSDAAGKVRQRLGNPMAAMIKTFADHDKPLAAWDDVMKAGGHKCQHCQGPGCAFCGGTGEVPPHARSGLVDAMEIERFAGKLPKPSEEN